MDSNLAAQSPDTSDIRPSFRKPSNDASHRKYRRHSPLSGSSSPSSSGGAKHNRSVSPDGGQGYSSKAPDGVRKERRIEGERAVRDYDRGHGRRGSDTYGYSERHSYSWNRDYHGRSDEYSYSRRYGGNDDREYQRYSSRSGRESKSGPRSEYSRRDDDHEKVSRDDRYNSDKGTRVKGFDESSRKRKDMEKNRDKDDGSRDRHKNLDRDICIEKPKNRGKHLDADMDIVVEKDKESDEMVDVVRDWGNKEHSRDTGNREPKKGRDDAKGRGKDDSGDCDESRNRARDKHKNIEKDSDTYKDDKVQHRKRDDVRERDQYKEKHIRDKEKHIRETDRHSKTESKTSSFYNDRDEKEQDHYQDGDDRSGRKGQENERGSDKVSRSVRDGKHQSDLYDKDGRKRQPISENAGQTEGKNTLLVDDKKSDKSTNKLPEAQGLSESASSIATEAEVAHDLNAARLAAIKAAELVNKNLGVSGSMSADQKKKLLWGSKKAAAPVESGSSCWEMAHFADPDRQEKFNKLMSLSAPCYIWPIVGCQRRSEGRKEGGRKRWAICYREAKGIAAGLGKAVYGRTEAPRWSDCWIRFIGFLFCNVPCVIHLDYLLGFPAIHRVHWAASSDNNRLTKAFCLTFACFFRLSILKNCNSLCYRPMSWHNLDYVCRFWCASGVDYMLLCTIFGCSMSYFSSLYFGLNWLHLNCVNVG